MEKYRFLDHTADAKFQAFGKTLEEAFSNAAVAMVSIMLDPEKIEKNIEKKIEITGSDTKSLLYNFLEEILFLLDTDGFILSEVMDLQMDNDECKLTATFIGDTISDKYRTAGDVKAVTYNDMEIISEKDKYTVQVVVDL